MQVELIDSMELGKEGVCLVGCQSTTSRLYMVYYLPRDQCLACLVKEVFVDMNLRQVNCQVLLIKKPVIIRIHCEFWFWSVQLVSWWYWI